MELGKLAEALDERGDVLVLRTPVGFYRKRGVTFLLAIPFLAVVFGGLCAGGIADGSGLSNDELNIMLAVLSVPVLAVAGAGFLAGVITLVRAPGKSEASTVRVDLGRRVLERGGQSVSLSEFSSLELVQPSKVLKWRSIRACRPASSEQSDNPYASSSRAEPMVLLENIEPLQGEAAGALLRYLGERMELQVRAAPGMDKSALGGLGGSSNHAAMLCYLPVQGIWLIASLGMLVFSKEPLVRFHAKQSLLMGAAHIGLAIAMVAGGAIGFEVLGSDAVGAVLMLLPLLPMMLLIVLRFVGAYKGHKGAWWVCPGLGWLTRRWIPEDAEA